VPIARGFLSIAGLHPLRRAHSLTWSDGRIVEVTDFGHATMATAVSRDCAKCWGSQSWISKSFVQAADGVREPLLSVGRHPLRGVREAQEVFTIYT
jgi:hypothetical protein